MTQTKLRGYYVCERGAEWGIPVVATSVKEAKCIGFGASEIDCDWIDLRCTWQREANVTGLPVGIIEDVMDALRRGLYSHIEDGTCDICGADDAYIRSVQGKAMCEVCVDNYEGDERL